MTMDNNNPTTREQIMTLLRKRGRMNANEIAKQLGITDIAVRRHLNNLERDRILHVETVRQAMGRPTFVYSLTKEAEDLFPKNYADITLEILNDIIALQGPSVIDSIFDRREDRLEQKYRQLLQAKGYDTLEQLVGELASLQEERGYMTEWRKEEDEGEARYIITEHNCPIHEIAYNFNKACESELSLFRKVLGAKVEQLECKAKGGERCIYEIKPKG